MNKKYLIGAFAVAVILVIVTIVALPGTPQYLASYPDLEKRIEVYRFDFPNYSIYIDPSRQTFRQQFCLYNPGECVPEPIQSSMISQLDVLYPMPNDFVDIKAMRAKGLIPYSDERITEDYWLQPEWESGYDMGINAMKGYKFGRYPMWCIFAFPSTHVVEIEKTEGAVAIEDVTLPIWIRSMWLTDKYSGFKASHVYPRFERFQGSSGMPYDPFNVTQNPDVARQHIAIEAEPDDNLVVGPNFPVFHVADDPKYKLKLDLMVSIDSDIPPGDYVVGLDFGRPDREFSEQNYLKYTFRRYNDPYSGGLYCGARGFRLFIRVFE
jgi:hypothetical protein